VVDPGLRIHGTAEELSVRIKERMAVGSVIDVMAIALKKLLNET